MPMNPSARMFQCARCHCQVIVCRHCDRGNVYCANGCADLARSASLRRAAFGWRIPNHAVIGVWNSSLQCDVHKNSLSYATGSSVLLAGLLRELLCSVMHCPAIGATGVPINLSDYNNLKGDSRHGVQVVGGSNPLAPTIFSMSYRLDKNNSCLK